MLRTESYYDLKNFFPLLIGYRTEITFYILRLKNSTVMERGGTSRSKNRGKKRGKI